MSLLKQININDPGTGFRFGGNDLDTINKLLSGEDLGYLLRMQNIFYFGGAQKLRILRPNNTNYISFNAEAETTNRAILIPPLTADQRMLFEALAQPLNNKSIRIDGSGFNTIQESTANATHVAAFDAVGNLIKKTLFAAPESGGKVSQSQINDNTKEKTGRFSGANYYEIRGEGLLDGLYGLGTVGNNLDPSGSSNTFKTGIVANASSGIVKVYPVATFNGWMRPNFLPTLRFKDVLPARTSGDSQFWYGWYTTQTLIPVSSNPMNVNDGGLLIGYNSTDPNIMIYYGPADGTTTPPTPVNTGLAIPTGTIVYIFEIIVNSATSYTINIYNTAGTGTLLYTTTITTNLPSGTKSLNFHNVLQNMTTTDKTITIYTGNGLSIR